jgi:hypothetical protein
MLAASKQVQYQFATSLKEAFKIAEHQLNFHLSANTSATQRQY